ncbi:MAG TPA: polysaccharide biosynthesis tyrosine autokinase [Acidimicrobiales bacterium]|nr:polysaccharide biosynthesis tyrosine autokinase [Acidimicrobiales bacterium]
MTDRRETDQLELRDYLTVLRRRKLTIALTAIAVVAVALGLSLLQEPQYRATAEILLRRQGTQDIISGDQQPTNSFDETQRVQTEIEVMRSRSVRDAVRDELGYTASVSIAPKGDTSVVSISATDGEPARAAREANAYAEIFITIRRDTNVAELEAAVEVLQQQLTEVDDQLQQADVGVAELQAQVDATDPEDPAYQVLLDQRDQAAAARDAQRISLQTQRGGYSERLGQLQLSLNGARADGGGEIVSTASEPASPFAPDPIRNAAIALVLGLLLGAGLAFLREYLDDRIRSKDDLDTVTGGVDVLGLIPRLESWRNRAEPQLVSLTAPKSPVAETYRGLRTSLQFIGVERTIKVIQLTSASASEGKTTTLANLGVTFARAGHRVVLIDCDLRRPRLHQFFGLDNHIGLTSMILGEHGADTAVQPVPDVPRLAVLASGPPPPNPSELLSSRTAQTLLDSIADYADYVLLDCPPLLPVADAVVLASQVDATVLVTTVGSTTKRGLRRSLELLDQVDAPLVGIVLNGLEAEAAYAYGYGYGYSYGGYDEGQRSSGLLGRRKRKGYASVSADEAAAAPLPTTEPVER